MGPITILNELSASVANHLGIAQNGDPEATRLSWLALASDLIPPTLEIETAARTKFRLNGSPECGTAPHILSNLKNGTSSFNPQRGGLGTFLWTSLRGDCLDELRRRGNRAAILRDRYPARVGGALADESEEGFRSFREAILSLGGRLTKVGALLWLDYWNLPELFNEGEALQIAHLLDANDGGAIELSKGQVARVLGVANATISRDARRALAAAGIQADDAGAAQPQVVLQCEPRAFDLALGCGAAQLLDQFGALRQAGGA